MPSRHLCYRNLSPSFHRARPRVWPLGSSTTEGGSPMDVRLDMIGIIARDMRASLKFYCHLGLEAPAGAEDEPHAEAITPGGLRVAWDTADLIKQLYPEHTEPAGGHRMALAFLCPSPADVDAKYAPSCPRPRPQGALERPLGPALRRRPRPGRQPRRPLRRPVARPDLAGTLPAPGLPRQRNAFVFSSISIPVGDPVLSSMYGLLAQRWARPRSVSPYFWPDEEKFPRYWHTPRIFCMLVGLQRHERHIECRGFRTRVRPG